LRLYKVYEFEATVTIVNTTIWGMCMQLLAFIIIYNYEDPPT